MTTLLYLVILDDGDVQYVCESREVAEKCIDLLIPDYKKEYCFIEEQSLVTKAHFS